MFRTMETLGRILTKIKDMTLPEERLGVVHKEASIPETSPIGVAVKIAR